MPVISSGTLEIDYSDEGHGPPVVLIHSSVSGNRQWRSLTDSLTDRYRVLAPNLYGYGGTTPWPDVAPQSLFAQAQIVLAVCEGLGEPVHLVGHSFGGRSRSRRPRCSARASAGWCCSSRIRSTC